MPVFDYRCADCGDRTEHILLPDERAPKKCKECGGKLKRAYGGSRVHINLQGWGFSKNDALLPERGGPRRDFKTLKERAQRIRDE